MTTIVSGPRLTPALVWLMSTATGLAVAGNYYAQPLLPAIATDMHLSAGAAGMIVTTAQAGYALGLLLIVPLGDLFERRRLIVLMSVFAAGGLLVSALSGGLIGLLIGTALAGVFSVVAQLLVPLAATLAEPAERGRVLGTVMSGLLLGILLARTVSGALADLGGWRTVYWVGAAAMLAMTALLAWRLPTHRQSAGLSYPRLLGSVLSLLRDEPVLRLRAFMGATAFAAFSVLWTSMAFLLAASPYGFSSATIGLFGLVGAAGALMANVAGRLVDRGHSRTTTVVFATLIATSFVLLWWGRHDLFMLIVGIVVLDAGVQGLHVTNQSLVYQLAPHLRSRVTSAYMVSCFVGGALGSALASEAFAVHRWAGVCVLGAVLGTAAWAVAVVGYPGRQVVRSRG